MKIRLEIQKKIFIISFQKKKSAPAQTTTSQPDIPHSKQEEHTELPNLFADCMIMLFQVPGEKSLGQKIQAFGGQLQKSFTPDVTHIVASPSEQSSTVLQAILKKFPKIHLITPEWINDCCDYLKRLPEKHYYPSSK